MSLEQIAAAVGRARSTIQIWLDRYREGGLGRLLEVRRGKGPVSALSAAAARALAAGLATGRWRTAGQVRSFLAKEHQLPASLSAVYKYLGKAGARLRVPRPVHVKKDPAAAAACKVTLAEKLGALEWAPGRPVRLWVMDEARFGLHTETRRVWALPGVRPSVAVQPKDQWQYVYGALAIGRAGTQFLHAESVGLEGNAAYLAQIGAHEPGAIHVVIYDGAGFHHRDGAAALPGNVRIINLPPSSPELNPVEKLWDIVRDGICNQVFAELADLQRALTEQLRRFWHDARAVFNLIGRGWLLAQANASGLSVIPM